MPWYEEAWHWAEKHPWLVGLGVFGIGAVVVLWWTSGSSSSSGPPLTFKQQLQLMKSQYAGQRSLISAQNAPALAQVRGQTAQTAIATRGQTAQARIMAATQNLATQLGYKSTLAGYANNLALEKAQAAATLAQEQQYYSGQENLTNQQLSSQDWIQWLLGPYLYYIEANNPSNGPPQTFPGLTLPTG